MSDPKPQMADADDDGLVIPGDTILICGVRSQYNEISIQGVSVPTVAMAADLTG